MYLFVRARVCVCWCVAARGMKVCGSAAYAHLCCLHAHQPVQPESTGSDLVIPRAFLGGGEISHFWDRKGRSKVLQAIQS